jgi:hypothetical protein
MYLFALATPLVAQLSKQPYALSLISTVNRLGCRLPWDKSEGNDCGGVQLEESQRQGSNALMTNQLEQTLEQLLLADYHIQVLIILGLTAILHAITA